MKFTTLEVSQNFQNLEQMLITSFYYVLNVINLFIPEKMSKENLYVLKIEIQNGYTKIPWRNKSADMCPDSLRYKAIGNSMAVPVMKWIGERIQKVDDIIKS